jgi:hypothetical protein
MTSQWARNNWYRNSQMVKLNGSFIFNGTERPFYLPFTGDYQRLQVRLPNGILKLLKSE